MCVSRFVCVAVDDTGSPAATICKSSRINWCLISYLAPTAVPETEESNEALFCRVRVTAGAVCTGWVTLQRCWSQRRTHWNGTNNKSVCPALRSRAGILSIKENRHLFPSLNIQLRVSLAVPLAFQISSSCSYTKHISSFLSLFPYKRPVFKQWFIFQYL